MNKYQQFSGFMKNESELEEEFDAEMYDYGDEEMIQFVEN